MRNDRLKFDFIHAHDRFGYYLRVYTHNVESGVVYAAEPLTMSQRELGMTTEPCCHMEREDLENLRKSLDQVLGSDKKDEQIAILKGQLEVLKYVIAERNK